MRTGTISWVAAKLIKPTGIPDEPGCYRFADEHGRVLYVGKARSLRSRIANYFQPLNLLHPRTALMLERAATVDWIVTANEVESLHLEYNLIKTHQPRYNIKYRDDKSYPYLAISGGAEVPKAFVSRAAPRKGVRRFGPYAHAYAIRETLDLLLKTFPVRTCRDGVYKRAERLGRACLLYDIGKCVGPCAGHATLDEHRAVVDGLIEFLDGDTDAVVERLRTDMQQASDSLEFERAARLRDQLQSVERVIEKQLAVNDRRESFDVVGIQSDDLEACICILMVRQGRLVGRGGAVVDKVEDADDATILAGYLRSHGLESDDVPREILVPVDPADAAALAEVLAEHRDGPVSFRIPQRGEKRALLEQATHNAAEAFTQHKLKRRTDFVARSRALDELREHLGLPDAPLRIECFDISNLGPDAKVASVVVFEDGAPKRSDYRRFKIRGVEGQDDFASMREVISRRFARAPEPDSGTGESPDRKPRFAYPPNLLVIDGGWGQLSAAREALEEQGVEVPAVGLMKRYEELALPGRSEPLVLPRGSDALYLLQHLRDEAHRFAVTYHRKLRGRSSTASALDEVPGIGTVRKKALLRRFGSVRRILAASEEELAEVVPAEVAGRIHGVLRGGQLPKEDRG
ncbi:MAG: excinuclease ABC subunit UvrC [Actinomycetota bacterium]